MKRIAALLLLLAISAHAHAGEVPEAKAPMNPWVAVGLFEGLIAVNAWMASKEPQVYGVVGALLFPVAAAESRNETTFWVSLAAAEALALYNIGLDKERYSEDEIFRQNMIGWHVFAGVVGLSMWLTGDEETGQGLSVGLAPTPAGGTLQLAYRF